METGIVQGIPLLLSVQVNQSDIGTVQDNQTVTFSAIQNEQTVLDNLSSGVTQYGDQASHFSLFLELNKATIGLTEEDLQSFLTEIDDHQDEDTIAPEGYNLNEEESLQDFLNNALAGVRNDNLPVILQPILERDQLRKEGIDFILHSGLTWKASAILLRENSILINKTIQKAQENFNFSIEDISRNLAKLLKSLKKSELNLSTKEQLKKQWIQTLRKNFNTLTVEAWQSIFETENLRDDAQFKASLYRLYIQSECAHYDIQFDFKKYAQFKGLETELMDAIKLIEAVCQNDSCKKDTFFKLMNSFFLGYPNVENAVQQVMKINLLAFIFNHNQQLPKGLILLLHHPHIEVICSLVKLFMPTLPMSERPFFLDTVLKFKNNPADYQAYEQLLVQYKKRLDQNSASPWINQQMLFYLLESQIFENFGIGKDGQAIQIVLSLTENKAYPVLIVEDIKHFLTRAQNDLNLAQEAAWSLLANLIHLNLFYPKITDYLIDLSMQKKGSHTNNVLLFTNLLEYLIEKKIKIIFKEKNQPAGAAKKMALINTLSQDEVLASLFFNGEQIKNELEEKKPLHSCKSLVANGYSSSDQERCFMFTYDKAIFSEPRLEKPVNDKKERVMRQQFPKESHQNKTQAPSFFKPTPSVAKNKQAESNQMLSFAFGIPSMIMIMLYLLYKFFQDRQETQANTHGTMMASLKRV